MSDGSSGGGRPRLFAGRPDLLLLDDPRRPGAGRAAAPAGPAREADDPTVPVTPRGLPPNVITDGNYDFVSVDNGGEDNSGRVFDHGYGVDPAGVRVRSGGVSPTARLRPDPGAQSLLKGANIPTDDSIQVRDAVPRRGGVAPDSPADDAFGADVFGADDFGAVAMGPDAFGDTRDPTALPGRPVKTFGTPDDRPADFGPAGFGPAGFGPADFGPADFGPADFGPAEFGPNDFGMLDEPDTGDQRFGDAAFDGETPSQEVLLTEPDSSDASAFAAVQVPESSRARPWGNPLLNERYGAQVAVPPEPPPRTSARFTMPNIVTSDVQQGGTGSADENARIEAPDGRGSGSRPATPRPNFRPTQPYGRSSTLTWIAFGAVLAVVLAIAFNEVNRASEGSLWSSGGVSADVDPAAFSAGTPAAGPVAAAQPPADPAADTLPTAALTASPPASNAGSAGGAASPTDAGGAAGAVPDAGALADAGTHAVATSLADAGVDDADQLQQKREARLEALKEQGYLQVRTSTPSTVYIDGKKIGQTPLGRLLLPAGTHSVRVVPLGGGRSQTMDARVDPGQLRMAAF